MAQEMGVCHGRGDLVIARDRGGWRVVFYVHRWASAGVESRWDLALEIAHRGITSASPVLGLAETIFLGINSNHCAVSASGRLLWAHYLSPNGYPPYDWIVATPWLWPTAR